MRRSPFATFIAATVVAVWAVAYAGSIIDSKGHHAPTELAPVVLVAATYLLGLEITRGKGKDDDGDS